MAQGHPQGWKGPKWPQRAALSRHSKGTEAQRGEGPCLRSLRGRRKDPSLRCLTQSFSTAPDGPWRPQGLGPCSQPGSQVSSQTNTGQAPPASPAPPLPARLHPDLAMHSAPDTPGLVMTSGLYSLSPPVLTFCLHSYSCFKIQLGCHLF